MVINAVGWNFLDQFKQAMLVHGAFAEDFSQLHARDETKRHVGCVVDIPDLLCVVDGLSCMCDS